jgi:hypothetical protein
LWAAIAACLCCGDLASAAAPAQQSPATFERALSQLRHGDAAAAAKSLQRVSPIRGAFTIPWGASYSSHLPRSFNEHAVAALDDDPQQGRYVVTDFSSTMISVNFSRNL